MTNSRLVARQSVATRDTKRTGSTRGIAEQPKKERRETGDRESEHLDSTDEGGELVLDEDPPEGSEMPHQTTGVGNYVECSET